MRKPNRPAPKVQEAFVPLGKEWITETREYEVITFLMGGGVEPYEVDPITVVRAAEIKGLLRYWWRAIRGGQSNGDLAKMREREAEIWGWSGDDKRKTGQSQVRIEVEILHNGKDLPKIKTFKGNVSIDHWSSPYSYVAFPLQKTNHKVRQGVRFRLILRYPSEFQDEVRAALWAWETFGGVGARTRRGFGALKRIDEGAEYPIAAETKSWIVEKLKASGSWPQYVPYLDTQMPLAVTKPTKSALQVWQELIRCLKNFRQARYPGKQPNRPGRSKWPEPDEIRRLWVQRARPTRPLAHSPVHPVHKFPRGQMGLPIVFHFKLDDHDKGKVVEPPDVILQGASHDRWASRLILKPLPCQKGFVGLVAVLQGPNKPPGGWRLTKGVEEKVEAVLTPKDAAQIEPLHQLGDLTDVLKAFITFVTTKNCQWEK